MLLLARKLSRPAELLRFASTAVAPPANGVLFRRFSSESGDLCLPTSSIPLASLRGGCYNDAAAPPPLLPLCPGCGVHMQESFSSLPGFFSRPSPKSPDYHAPLRPLPLAAADPLISLSLKSGLFPDEARITNPNPNPSSDPRPLVCARCHSLRHYGRVKVPGAEDLLPDFDFDRTVGPRMCSPSGPRTIVLAVVDAADFDGSFPRRVARLVSAALDYHSSAWKEGKPSNLPRLLLAVTKLDLLPPSAISPDDFLSWVRQRAHVNGSVRLAGVHFVSALKSWGIRELVDHLRELTGRKGNVWAVGAQNAGKSTLINAMGKCTGGKTTHLTEAPVPGTTLGIVRVEGVLGDQRKLFDTPGILHPYQITTRLTHEEQKLVHIGKELRPRTYRIKEGHSVHIGGLLRVDVETLSVQSIYLTVWASPLVPLHMGRTECASTMINNHFGRQLQPPIGEKRVDELGKWVRKEFNVRGNSWDASSTDIAAAGLGWVAIGLKGDAMISVWTYEGIDVVLRDSLISGWARIFEETGFSVSKIVSHADSALNRHKLIRSREEKESNGIAKSCNRTLAQDAGLAA